VIGKPGVKKAVATTHAMINSAMAQHPGKIKLNIWACLMKRGALNGLETSLEAISNLN
jgi:hypothetical protein